MPPPSTPSESDAVLRRVATGSDDALGLCIREFGDLLFALAGRYPFRDREQAVFLALMEVKRWAHRWPGTGLSARLWVLGVVKRRFDALQDSPVTSPPQ